MKRTDLVKVVAKNTGYSKEQVKDILDNCFSTIEERIVFGEDVIIHGFATFKLNITKPRKRYNIQSGESEMQPSRYRLSVSMATEIKEAIRNKTCYDGTQEE